MAKIVKTVCQMCNRYCGMNVYVENGKMVKAEGMLESPVSLGGLCPKGLSAVQYEYDEKRLMHPLKRVGERGGGKWTQISWDEALNVTAERLQDILKKDGARSIAFYKGQGGGWESIWKNVIWRFMNVLGSPNYCAHSHLCYIPMMMGMIYTTGGVPLPDVDHTNCILLWGFNPFTSAVVNFGRRLLDAKQRGAKVVVIDPRFTAAASKADFFIQPRPGTDGALALGMMNVILSRELCDNEFIAKWTYGFSQLKELIQNYTPRLTEEITGVPAATVEEIATLYATTKPSCIGVGNGIDQHSNSVQASRAIACLMAITGNIENPGGNIFLPRFTLADMTLADKLPPNTQAIDKHPLYARLWGVPGPDMLDTLISDEPYPIKGLIAMAGDPATSLSDTGRARQALKKLDFLVVHDLFMTAAAELADIVLPAASCFEYSQVIVYPFLTPPSANSKSIALRNKVVDAPGECHSDFEFILELAKKLGLGEYFPWNNVEEAFEEELKPTGFTLRDLKENPAGISVPLEHHEVYMKHIENGFPTPTKKVELYSTTFEEHGYDPLPNYEEPGERPISGNDMAEKYPLLCSAAIKPVLYTHNQFRTVEWLREIMPDPWVEIHPQRAKDLGIGDGELVVVESPRGSIKVKAKLSRGKCQKVRGTGLKGIGHWL